MRVGVGKILAGAVCCRIDYRWCAPQVVRSSTAWFVPCLGRMYTLAHVSEPALKVRRILVPIDFTPEPIAAIRHAVALGRPHRSFLYLLHVQPPPRQRQWPMDGSPERGRTAAYRHLIDLIGREGLDPFTTTGLVRSGSPDDVVADYALEINADLIVLEVHVTPPPQPLGNVAADLVERIMPRPGCSL